MKTIHEVAEMSGVTVRALQYYDKVGLLAPDSHSDAGYRLYSLDNLFSLQKILIYKELGFSLEEIKSLMFDHSTDEKIRLKQQKELLADKKKRLEKMINWVDDVLNDKKEVNFEAFKNLVISTLPTELNDEQKLSISPESYENIQNIWGDKSGHALARMDAAFENKSLKDLQENTRESVKLQKAILDETDKTQVEKRIKAWVNFDAQTYHMTDEMAYIRVILEEYQRQPELMKKTMDQQLGDGATARFAELLSEFLEKQPS